MTTRSLLLALALMALSLLVASAFVPRTTTTTRPGIPAGAAATFLTRPAVVTAPPVQQRTAVLLSNDDNNVQTTTMPERTEATKTSSVNESNTIMMQAAVEEKKETENKDNTNLMQKIKDAGVAGAISLGIWEGLFWCFSIPVALIGYQQVTGHWPDLSDKEDLAKLGAEAFAFVNFARFAVPLRVGLALSTTPWVQENIVNKFGNKEEEDELERPEIKMMERESNNLKK